MSPYLKKSPEVAAALAEGKAVVALESTIISHGMPYPENVETALKVEKVVRAAGAVPATIAILDGKLCAGLSLEQIETLGKEGTAVAKASRRDIPFLLARKELGATTVAATMIIAAQAGIELFATGGIGGVHRGGAMSFDISADLQELARTSVAVVCAGAKSILDLPLTLEYLETYGVPVIGYQTNEFPAFYSRESGLSVDYALHTPAEIAEVLNTKWSAGLVGGAIIANPVPEKFSMDATYLNGIIEHALIEATRDKIKGKAVTPYLLSKVKELTAGKSLVSNIELVLNNARLAAEIAVARS
ncbi:pseudouridine-5'-phosphate glycosidase [Lewinella cohaerens]|uniref:pseudouridine-5'-phosphate glycosidase n=1 Tax=Lewinella cohaerens TaxID=70995 RepID=UPI000379F4A2|nr:pseudouridine-5'-phosphate glycosidase [Lewinella cohaerens]